MKKEKNKISLKFKAGVKKREKSLIEVLTVWEGRRIVRFFAATAAEKNEITVDYITV